MLPLSNPLTSPEKSRKSRPLAPVLDLINPSRSSKPPHIRTPSTSRSPSNTPGSSLSCMSALPRNAGLPRGLTRLLVIVLTVGSIVGLVHISRGGVEEGLWDASSYADRRGSSPHTKGGIGAVKKRIERLRLTNPNAEEPAVPPVDSGITRRPNLSRQNFTLPRPIHTGVSRKAVIGSPDKYTTAPLPNIEEAWAWLHPRLREIKRKVPSIPREHQLWNPLFSPALTEEMKLRYTHLRMDWDEDKEDWVPATKRYYFVTLCRQVAGMLADWFAAWTVLADYLGPESIYFSLHEGDSADGTGEIISGVLRDYLLFLGVPPENIYIRTFLPKVDWEAAHRIELLADMRNQAMKPFYDSAPEGLSPDGHPWSAVIWYNDVYLSGTHFLELLHQHFMQDADMSCGWDHAGRWFYDGWVGRDMSGDLYTPFPVKEEDKDLPQKLFINHWPTKARFDRLLPFQVFAGWNGVTVINPTPFLPPYNVRFRRGAKAPPTGDLTAADMECQASESSFISWDFWKYGFGRIQTVPGIHACYGKEDAQMRGWVEFPNPDEEEGYSEMIAWQDQPPARIRCHDWPDKPGKGYWAWDTVRWVPPPEFVKVTAE